MIPTNGLKLGDVFKRKDEVWVVESWCAEPTVTMRKVWPPDSPVGPGSFVTQRGGISGLMWDDFEKMGMSE